MLVFHNDSTLHLHASLPHPTTTLRMRPRKSPTDAVSFQYPDRRTYGKRTVNQVHFHAQSTSRTPPSLQSRRSLGAAPCSTRVCKSCKHPQTKPNPDTNKVAHLVHVLYANASPHLRNVETAIDFSLFSSVESWGREECNVKDDFANFFSSRRRCLCICYPSEGTTGCSRGAERLEEIFCRSRVSPQVLQRIVAVTAPSKLTICSDNLCFKSLFWIPVHLRRWDVRGKLVSKCGW